MTDIFIAYCQPNPDEWLLIGAFTALSAAKAGAMIWARNMGQRGMYRSLSWNAVWRPDRLVYSAYYTAEAWINGDLLVERVPLNTPAPIDPYPGADEGDGA